MLQVARTIGMGTARIAEANRELIVRTLMQPGDTERDLALRFAAAAEHMLPLVEPTLALRAAGAPARADPPRRDRRRRPRLRRDRRRPPSLAVCFADLVEFTKLGEEIAAEELGLVAGRLEEMATAVAEPPVRLVKMIGDAAMLVSTERRADGRRGAAPDRGRRGGGRGVPAACAPASPAARPGPVRRLLRPPGQPRQPHHRRRQARQRPRRRGGQGGGAGEGFDYSFAGERRLKGFDSRCKLFRVRRERGERG